MTVPSGTTQSYQRVGDREDLEDMIYDISPVEVPFMSMAKRGKAKRRYPEWQTDSLAAASGTNAVVEGDDAANDTASPTTRVRNYTQLFDKVAQVSSSVEAEDAAGRKRELAYQLVKRSQELKRDIETRLTGNYASVAGAASTARELGGLESWYVTNVSRGASADAFSGGYTSTGVTIAAGDESAGGLRTFTETLLKSVIKQVWSSGGNPGIIMTGGFNKQVASTFAGISTLYQDLGARPRRQATILAAADTYVSDFGTHHIVPNRFSRDRSVHVLDMRFFSVDYLQPFKVEKLAKTGHSERRMISAELTLKVKNEAASGVVADLLTSGFTP